VGEGESVGVGAAGVYVTSSEGKGSSEGVDSKIGVGWDKGVTVGATGGVMVGAIGGGVRGMGVMVGRTIRVGRGVGGGMIGVGVGMEGGSV